MKRQDHPCSNLISPIVRVEHLGKQVDSPEGRLTLLADIDLEVNAGESLAILGASGSGKSTLLGLVAGLDRPTSGRIWLAGVDLNALNEEGLAQLRGQMLGFVFQSFQLLPHLDALENVMLPLELLDQAQDAPMRARAILEEVGLGHRLGHLPSQLSGGEQQRVAIARAFVTRPALLLADEPTGNLDQTSGEAVMRLLFDLNAEHQTTLLLVTHDHELAARCKRRIRLHAGSLVESG